MTGYKCFNALSRLVVEMTVLFFNVYCQFIYSLLFHFNRLVQMSSANRENCPIEFFSHPLFGEISLLSSFYSFALFSIFPPLCLSFSFAFSCNVNEIIIFSLFPKLTAEYGERSVYACHFKIHRHIANTYCSISGCDNTIYLCILVCMRYSCLCIAFVYVTNSTNIHVLSLNESAVVLSIQI